jgi:ATP-dependent DNA ligase
MLDGRDLRMEPLADRRKRLEDLVQGHPESRIHFSANLVGNGPAMFRAADAMGLEGVVSKRPESRYISGRTKAWLKVKTFTESVYDVVGVEENREGATMALLATRGTEPKLVGTAFVTLGGEERETFWSKVKKLGTPQSQLRAHQKRKALWLAQGLTARVRHLRGEETLRHATVRAVVDPDTPATPPRKPEAR